MDDLVGEPMQLENVILVQLGHSFRGHCHTGGHHMDLLGELVHKDMDCIVSLGLWECSNQIYADFLSRLSGHIVGVQGVMGALTYWLYPLALFTALYILANFPLNPWPPVVASDELMCLVSAWVSSQGRVVMKSDNVLPSLAFLGSYTHSFQVTVPFSC